jgi:predicted short-subunit dehydrogenase-like oxidoreductase (DUF2520 family)
LRDGRHYNAPTSEKLRIAGFGLRVSLELTVAARSSSSYWTAGALARNERNAHPSKIFDLSPGPDGICFYQSDRVWLGILQMPKISQTRKPTVSIIGAGRLGQALAIALQSSGYPIMALVARHRQKAEKAAALLTYTKLQPQVLAANQLMNLGRTELILIATPDDAIAKTARILAGLFQGQQGRTVLHTSGALSSAVLSPLAEKGFYTGSMHPLVSISDPVSGAQALRGAFYCLEGTRQAKLVAQSIVRDLSGRSFSIKPESKALYHAAAVMASPHLVALFDLATEMLAACGLNKGDAQKVLLPLLESTVNNLKASDPQKALTGTFARGDVATVRRHLSALSGKDLTQAREVYKLLGLRSVQLAKSAGSDPDRISKITELLKAVKPASR